MSPRQAGGERGGEKGGGYEVREEKGIEAGKEGERERKSRPGVVQTAREEEEVTEAVLEGAITKPTLHSQLSFMSSNECLFFFFVVFFLRPLRQHAGYFILLLDFVVAPERKTCRHNSGLKKIAHHAVPVLVDRLRESRHSSKDIRCRKKIKHESNSGINKALEIQQLFCLTLKPL